MFGSLLLTFRQPDNDQVNEIMPTPSTPNGLHGDRSPTSLLATPLSAGGRDRSLSGSTAAYSTLKVPDTSHGEKSSASSIFSELDREDALKPDPGSEKDFQVQDNKSGWYKPKPVMGAKFDVSPSPSPSPSRLILFLAT